ncbi:MAG: DUF2975 domain-containing protein [Acidimicrobiia bacterium]|nr:DUF2975 domain-containing protein [Acidimicrobiia bacterium]
MSTRLPRLLRGFTTLGMVLLAGATIALIILGALLIGNDGLQSADLAVPIQFSVDADAYPLISESWGNGQISRAVGTATFDDPSFGLAIAAAAAVIAGVVAAFIVLILLRRIFGTMVVGTPFLTENVTRIRWLGFIVIGAAVVEQIIQIALGLIVLDNVSSTGLDIAYHFDLNLAAVFVGLIILSLAEVFRYGMTLQADSDLTV